MVLESKSVGPLDRRYLVFFGKGSAEHNDFNIALLFMLSVWGGKMFCWLRQFIFGLVFTSVFRRFKGR